MAAVRRWHLMVDMGAEWTSKLIQDVLLGGKLHGVPLSESLGWCLVDESY